MNSNTISFGREEGGIVILREGVDMVVVPGHYDRVSGNHADITRSDDGSFLLADHSRNGTLVNGQLVHNMTVKITGRDRILLAGQYEVNWSIVSELLSESNERKTVIHSSSQSNSVSRATRMFNQGLEERQQQSDFQPVTSPKIEATTSHRDLKLALRKFNWGAFFLTFFWGLFHKIYWPMWLLIANGAAFAARALMPRDGVVFFWLLSYLANLGWVVMAFYLGFRGNEMAWKRRCYRNLEDFKQKEHRWTVTGLVVGLLALITIIVAVILFSEQIDFF